MNRPGLPSVLIFASLLLQEVRAGNAGVRINEVMAGLNGDSSIQFVELAVQDETQKAWGPQGVETTGRCLLLFHGPDGRQTGRYVFPRDPAIGASVVLIATAEFAASSGLTPDFIMPRLVMPTAGKVTFCRNPDNGNGEDVSVSLSYGGSLYTGGGGAPNPASPGIMGSRSLRRSTHFDSTGFGTSGASNADFSMGAPTPAATATAGVAAQIMENTAGGVVLPAALSEAAQGANLFNRETFLGNGRTCATCHAPAERFGLTPARIASLPPDDPLFIADFDINALAVGGISQPSDFRLGDTITGSLGGSAVVLAGTGGNYQIIGGAALAVAGNVISDAAGNRAVFTSFTPGNLQGPTPTNTDAFGLEQNSFLKGPRALFVENINGTGENGFMRSSPSLMNVKYTAPYGWSGEFADLQSFSAGAIAQHAPRSLNRVPGVDFRVPTAEELDALAAFQNSLTLPANENFDEANLFERFLTTDAQRRGRDAFFGSQAKCGACHGGKTLSQGDGRFNTTAGLNQLFDTRVSLQFGNFGLPSEQATGFPPNTRQFNVPSLLGIGKTAPYFHENSAASLTVAISFYNSLQFNSSPASIQIGGIGAPVNALNSDLAAFLSVVGEEPDQPVISGITASQLLTGNAGVPPFPAVTISDATIPEQVLTVTVTLDNPAKGILTNAGGFTVSGPGAWQFNGTASQATAALRAIVFEHGSGRLQPGQSEMTRFTLGVNDGVAGTVFNDATTINATAGDNASISAIPAQSTLMNTSLPAVPFTLSGMDPLAPDFMLSVTSSAPEIVPPGSLQFGGAGISRTLSITPAADATGTAQITLSATQGGKSAVRSFALTVSLFQAGFAVVPAGGGSIRFAAVAGRRYWLEKSAGMVTWTRESSAVATSATGEFSIPPGNSPRSFYRVVPEP